MLLLRTYVHPQTYICTYVHTFNDFVAVLLSVHIIVSTSRPWLGWRRRRRKRNWSCEWVCGFHVGIGSTRVSLSLQLVKYVVLLFHPPLSRSWGRSCSRKNSACSRHFWWWWWFRMSGRGGGIGIVSPAQSAAAAAGSIIPLLGWWWGEITEGSKWGG